MLMILKLLIQIPEQDVLLTRSYFRAAVALHKFIPSVLICASFREIGKIKQQALFQSPCCKFSYVENSRLLHIVTSVNFIMDILPRKVFAVSYWYLEF